jgi:dihydrofolate reductase
VTVIGDDLEQRVRELKAEPGKDIWLFGGGSLFASLLDAGLVDVVELAIIPALLGRGIPLLAPTSARHSLALRKHQVFPKTGTALMTYEPVAPTAPRRSRGKRAAHNG